MEISSGSHPSRRMMLAGALGVGAAGGLALTGDAATAAVGDVQIPSASTQKFYLSLLPSIPGDVLDRGLEGQISVITWGWGAHNSSDPLGPAGGSGKSAPDDLIVVAKLGSHSPKVSLSTDTGRIIPSATLIGVKGSSTLFTYLSVKVSNVVVVSYYLTPSPTDGYPLDVFHLKYTKVSETYTPQKPDGSAGTPVTTSYDYKTASTLAE